MTTTVDAELEAFWSHVRPVSKQATRTCRVTCRVCNALTTVALDAPARLCPECSRDLDATEAHVTCMHDKVLARQEAAHATFDQAVLNETEMDQQRYDAVRAALVQVAAGRLARAKFDRSYQAALAADDGLGRILNAEQERERIAETCNHQFEWARIALDELATARAAQEEARHAMG